MGDWQRRGLNLEYLERIPTRYSSLVQLDPGHLGLARIEVRGHATFYCLHPDGLDVLAAHRDQLQLDGGRMDGPDHRCSQQAVQHRQPAGPVPIGWTLLGGQSRYRAKGLWLTL